ESPIHIRAGDVNRMVVVPVRRVLVLQQAAIWSVRVEIVSELPDVEEVERMAIVLGCLKSTVSMDRGDRLADPTIRHQVVHKPDDLGLPALRDNRGAGDHAVVTPERVLENVLALRRLGVKSVDHRLLGDEERGPRDGWGNPLTQLQLINKRR